MRIESAYVFLDDVCLHGHHGVMAQEQAVGADFLVSLRVRCEASRAALTDDVADTVSYAELYATVSREMQQPSRLLEHVAARMARAVLDEQPQVSELWLRLTKKNPPMGADCRGAGVEIHVTREKTAGG